MKRKLIVLLLFFLPLVMYAQWRIGLAGGASYNLYERDNHYMVDWHYKGAWGGTVGIMGQYDFSDWFGLRTELNWTTKCYKQYRTELLEYDNYKIKNYYLQIPLMMSFSFGKEKIRGFLNIGVYGGYLLSKWYNGSTHGILDIDNSNLQINPVSGTGEIGLNNDCDNRLDYGFVGGIGTNWKLSKSFSVQVEARCYYSTSSIQKDYMKIKDPRYNTTFIFQTGVCYYF